MRKEKVIEVKVCDCCGSDESVFDTCLGCGKDVCYECTQERDIGIDYYYEVSCSSSMDGYFCDECNQNPPDEVKELHKLYLEIQSLTKEREQFYENFKEKSKKVEEELVKEHERVVEE